MPHEEQKPFIPGAGDCIVSKSILNGTSCLKWLFREKSDQFCGWIAFGDTDTQEVVDNPANMAIANFNALIDLEPAAANVYFLPPGADLELRRDANGAYFTDVNTGEEYREMVKGPIQIAFEKNLKFLNQESYPPTFFQGLFGNSGPLQTVDIGKASFPTGKVVLADPLAYLGSKYQTCLERKIPAGSYPVELSLLRSPLVGLRVAGARLVIKDSPIARYEIAMPTGKEPQDLGYPGVFSFFGVDTGLACITDWQIAEQYTAFMADWEQKHPGGNRYTDLFEALFHENAQAFPQLQNEQGDFLLWRLPGTDLHLPLFSSGLGDGIYSGYWGLDRDGQPVQLIIPFLNPEFFL